ncbi:MAG: hypothetical protein OEW75_04120, partial [Cyclobacteriaceae bacterium]|nr:hypothetical protein [Cyclobacteriaceae bacterium]
TDYEEPAADTTYSDSNWDDGGWDYNWDDQSTTETQDTSDPNYDPWAETQSTYEEPEPIDPLEYMKPKVVLPVPNGPVIYFTGLNLNIVSPYDSVFVKNTAGFYNVKEAVFTGEKGRMDFEIAGLPPDSVYADLEGYTFKVGDAQIKSIDSKLTYIGKLDEPIEGIFTYKRSKHDSLRASKYPQFLSYRANNVVESLAGKDMTYKGGFSLQGAKITSQNFLKMPSRIDILALPGKKFIAESQEFIFGDSSIASSNASVRIIHKRDSIYNPSVQLLYKFNSKQLTIRRPENSYRNAPIKSSYFNMNILTEEINWDLNTDSMMIHIRDARSVRSTVFESIDHYEKDDFINARGHYEFNPLIVIGGYANETGLDEFHISDVSQKTRIDYQLLVGATVMLAEKGLVDFDTNTGMVKVSHQAKLLVLAYIGQSDYDDIIIESVMEDKPNSPNAILYLDDERIEVEGVEFFQASDSLNVEVLPDSFRITLLKDRGIKFDGTITAGNFEYKGQDFVFRYDSFLVNMGTIEQVKFFTTDSLGNRLAIDNNMVGLDSASAAVAGIDMGENQTSGTLYINDPNNKSAKIKYPNYPNFNSGLGSVVYFDGPEIFGGRYDKSIFFVAPPYDIDSLGNSDPTSIVFQGKFSSGGMFPVFEEELKYQPDNSMGFYHEIPSDGYQLYEGAGKIYGDIRLNKKGIRSNGQIDFLSTTLLSDEFIFYPDSVTALGNVAEIREEEHGGVIFPQADLSNFRMRWVPRRDSLYVYNMGDPFQFYNGTASLDGEAIVSNSGVYGKGTLISRGSTAESDRLTFRHNSYSARNAQFKVESGNPEKPALAGTDVRLNFNLDENYAEISPEIEGEAAVEFPYAQFRTSIPDARWDLNEQKIYMTKPADVPIENSYFYTTREDLDSLRFSATSAVYDINTLELKVSGIPFIIVADARITPENNEVLIHENSRIGTLSNTVIVLDTLSGHHRLYDGVIDVKSRNEFSGYATYELVNAIGDTFAIKMTDFRLEEFEHKEGRRTETKMHTVANGTVTEKENILMSPGMYFKGDVKLEAHNPMLHLNGSVKLNLTKKKDYNTWIVYNHQADQSKIAIDFDKSVTDEGRKLDAGLYFSAEDNSLYSLFVEIPITIYDELFFKPEGTLYFDENDLKFVIETEGKSTGEKYEGKIYTYDQSTGIITFEGLADFFKPTRKASINASIIGQGNVDSLDFSVNTLMALDFDIPRQALDIMAYNLQDIIEEYGAPDGLGDPTELLYKLGSLMGEEDTREYEQTTLSEYVSLGGYSGATSKPLLFSDINLKWSKEYKAFYSEGLLGMSNILTNDVNAAWEGFMEIAKGEDGLPIFNLFFKATADSWYYLNYQDGRLMLFSSVEEYNAVIAKRTNSAKAKVDELVFTLGNKAETLEFINRFRKQYYGIDGEYMLDAEANLDQKEKKKDKETDKDDGF